MKKFLCGTLLLGLIACGQQSEEGVKELSDISIVMDTLVVDSKDEILYLNNNISHSDLSEDKRFLFNFNLHDYSIEKIDLDRLEFVEKFPFQKEGPDAVGDYVNTVQLLDAENIFLSALVNKGIYNFSGKRLQNLTINEEKLNPAPPEGYSFGSFSHFIPGSESKIVGNIENYQTGGYKVGLIEVNEGTWEEIPIPEFDFLDDYRTVWMGPYGLLAITGRWISKSLMNEKIIIANTVCSDFYSMDLNSGELEYLTFEHTLFPKRKQGSFPKIIESEEAYQEVNRDYLKEITFYQPVWDDLNKVYYRFASKEFPKEIDGEWVSGEAEVFLIILDEKFNLMHEVPLKSYKKRPNFHFVKDGKIWMFENMEDEMGFLVMGVLRKSS